MNNISLKPAYNLDTIGLDAIGDERLSLKNKILEINWLFILLVATVAGLGTAFLWGASGGSWQPWAAAHMWRSIIGLAAIPIIALVGIRIWWHWAYVIYLAVVVGLIATSFFGVENFGAKRWIVIAGFSLQE